MNPESQISKSWILSTLIAGGLAWLAIILPASVAFGQGTKLQGEVLQEKLIAQLSTGDEEQRLNALAQLSIVFNAAPNSASPRMVTALTNALQRDASPLVRALSARALGTCCDQQVTLILTEGLANEREVAVRKAIVYSLAYYHSSQVTSTLILLLKDKSPEIRGVATYALAEIGDPTSWDALMEILQNRRKDEDAFARGQATRALGRIGNRQAIDVLIQLLLREKNQEVRREAVRALGLLASKQDTNVIETLREATLHADPMFVDAARDALDKINMRSS